MIGQWAGHTSSSPAPPARKLCTGPNSLRLRGLVSGKAWGNPDSHRQSFWFWNYGSTSGTKWQQVGAWAGMQAAPYLRILRNIRILWIEEATHGQSVIGGVPE